MRLDTRTEMVMDMEAAMPTETCTSTTIKGVFDCFVGSIIGSVVLSFLQPTIMSHVDLLTR
uniref:Uncharacterized protein n=1 Tax=Anopheles dirus TaxID=7168 RepID=A0A182N9I0_9DIPT